MTISSKWLTFTYLSCFSSFKTIRNYYCNIFWHIGCHYKTIENMQMEYYWETMSLSWEKSWMQAGHNKSLFQLAQILSIHIQSIIISPSGAIFDQWAGYFWSLGGVWLLQFFTCVRASALHHLSNGGLDSPLHATSLAPVAWVWDPIYIFNFCICTSLLLS